MGTTCCRLCCAKCDRLVHRVFAARDRDAAFNRDNTSCSIRLPETMEATGSLSPRPSERSSDLVFGTAYGTDDITRRIYAPRVAGL